MTGLRVVGSAMREGPEAWRVAARLRLMSVPKNSVLLVPFQFKEYNTMRRKGKRLIRK